jgi:hypothetical protein
MSISSGEVLTGPETVLLPTSSHSTVPVCDSTAYKKGKVNPINIFCSDAERTGENGIAGGISDYGVVKREKLNFLRTMVSTCRCIRTCPWHNWIFRKFINNHVRKLIKVLTARPPTDSVLSNPKIQIHSIPRKRRAGNCVPSIVFQESSP